MMMHAVESLGAIARLFRRQSLFADLLASVRLRDVAYLRCDLRAPWGLRIVSGNTTFHIIIEGSWWLRVQGVAVPIKPAAGDLVVLPRGGKQSLGDSYASPIIDTISFLRNESLKPTVKRVGGTLSLSEGRRNYPKRPLYLRMLQEMTTASRDMTTV
jgi:cupin